MLKMPQTLGETQIFEKSAEQRTGAFENQWVFGVLRRFLRTNLLRLKFLDPATVASWRPRGGTGLWEGGGRAATSEPKPLRVRPRRS